MEKSGLVFCNLCNRVDDFCVLGVGLMKAYGVKRIIFFKCSSTSWAVPEKENFATGEAMTRFDYLVVGNTVSYVRCCWAMGLLPRFALQECVCSISSRISQVITSLHSCICTWLNSTVEVSCRELLRSTRALLSEFQLWHWCWPFVLPIAQSALNSSVLERLGNSCPLTDFTIFPKDYPLTSIALREKDVLRVYSIE